VGKVTPVLSRRDSPSFNKESASQQTVQGIGGEIADGDK